MLSIIYTPTVGDACERFSDIYRRACGVFISYSNRDKIENMLQNASKQNIKVIVVTNDERILGLGDQGIVSKGIPVGKVSFYTDLGGISITISCRSCQIPASIISNYSKIRCTQVGASAYNR